MLLRSKADEREDGDIVGHTDKENQPERDGKVLDVSHTHNLSWIIR